MELGPFRPRFPDLIEDIISPVSQDSQEDSNYIIDGCITLQPKVRFKDAFSGVTDWLENSSISFARETGASLLF